MNLEILQTRMQQCNLRPSEVVKMSYGLVTINQAQQWVDFHKTGRKLSAPVIVMLLKMCEDKERGIASMDGELTKERILSMATNAASVFTSGVYFLIKGEELIYIGKSDNSVSRIKGHLDSWEKDFTKVFVLKVPPEKIDEVESFYIDKFTPILNRNTKSPYGRNKLKKLTQVGDLQNAVFDFEATETTFRAYGNMTVKGVGDFWIYEVNGKSWKVPIINPCYGVYKFGNDIFPGKVFSKK